MPAPVAPINATLGSSRPFKAYYERADVIDLLDAYQFVQDFRDDQDGAEQAPAEPEVVAEADALTPERVVDLRERTPQYAFQVPELNPHSEKTALAVAKARRAFEANRR